MTRDPRVNPKAGDVLRKGTLRRQVYYCEYGGMAGESQMSDRIQCIDGGWIKPPRESRPSRAQFRKWAKDAEVVHAAD